MARDGRCGGTRSSTWSCTPATARARARSTPSSALAHGADRCRLRRYHALGLGGAFGGGIVECPTRRPVWLPYVEVDASTRSPTARAGSAPRVLLEPREGPAGWRSVVATPEGGEIAFWQPKARRGGWGG